ncbi:MAG: MFS transporter [Fibrella sp.]|nr:MFS transporter [Armatimonadota bacterium]
MVEPFLAPAEPEDPVRSPHLDALKPGGALYAFSFPNFRLFFFGQLVSVAGTWMQNVAQQWLVYELTQSSVWLGVVAGATALPHVLFAFWGGSVADRFPRRSILLCTQSVAMISALVLATLATNRVVPIQAWHIAIIAGLGGIINAFNMPAQQAFVTQMVDDPKALGNAIGLNSLRFNFARFLGPMFAGITLVNLGAAWCFFLNGLSFIAVILSLSLMRVTKAKSEAKSGTNESPWEGARFLLGVPSLFRVVILIGSGSLLVLAVSTLYPVLAGVYNGGASGFSTLVTVNGIGATIGGIGIVTIGSRIQRRNLVYGGATLFCIALLILSFSRTFIPALICLFFAGIAMVVFTTSTNTKVQTEAPDELRGRVMAMYLLVANTSMPLGGLLLGFLAQHFQALPTIRLSAGIMLAITIGVWLWSTSDRARK